MSIQTAAILVAANREYNALYEDGLLVQEGDYDIIDPTSIYSGYRHLGVKAKVYLIPEDVYDRELAKDGYPDQLSEISLNDCIGYTSHIHSQVC